MLYERLSKWYINGYPSSLSFAFQCGLLTIFQANHQHLFKWIISHHHVDNRSLSKYFMNGYPNGLSMAIQIVYQPPSM